MYRILLLFISTLLYACSGSGSSTKGGSDSTKNDKPPVETGSAVGMMAPDFTLKSIDGSSKSLKDLKGKIVFIDFWASWCPPCRASNPELAKIAEKYAPKGVEFVSISIDSNEKEWKDAVKKDKMTWMQLLDDKTQAIADNYDVVAVPTSFLLDKQGKIIFKGTGSDILSQIEPTLAGIVE